MAEGFCRRVVASENTGIAFAGNALKAAAYGVAPVNGLGGFDEDGVHLAAACGDFGAVVVVAVLRHGF